jgi:hypothetical protein
MGVRNSTGATTTVLNASMGSGADTVVFTTPPIGLVQDNAQVMIFYSLIVTLGSTATGFQLRLFRGASATGSAINVTVALTTVATNIVSVSGCYIDTPGVVGQGQYSLIGHPSGGGTASAATDGCLIAMVL